MSMLRLLAWNIRQGGGARLAAITEAIARHDADIAVISEYRGGEAGIRLREALAGIGYRWSTRLVPPIGRSGVLIATRRRFRHHGALGAELPEPYRIVAIEARGIRLCGVYMPNMLAKVPYWEALIAALAVHQGGAALAIGDFNTCRAYVDEPGAIDRTAHFLDKIEAIGFCDLWRRRNPDAREFSWYSHRGNGFRIDHAFLSPALAARAGSIRYSHAERLAGLSDHSPLLLDLRL
jgi:exodeoxyribonuclease III